MLIDQHSLLGRHCHVWFVRGPHRRQGLGPGAQTRGEFRGLVLIQQPHGIGAGPGCDGQVLVFHDLVGLYDRFTPKFVKQYAQLGATVREAVQTYIHDVKTGNFPGPEHVFK